MQKCTHGVSFLLFLRKLFDKLVDLFTNGGDLGFKLGGGDAQDSRVDGGELQEFVSRNHTNVIVGAKLVHHTFNVGIGGLVFLGIYNAVAVVRNFRSRAVRYKVGIKHQRQLDLGKGSGPLLHNFDLNTSYAEEKHI